MFSLSEDPAQVLYYLPEKFYHFVHEYYTHTSLSVTGDHMKADSPEPHTANWPPGARGRDSSC